MAGPVGVDELAGFGQQFISVGSEVISLGLDEVGRDPGRSRNHKTEQSQNPLVSQDTLLYLYPSKKARAVLKAGVGTPSVTAVATTLRQDS